MLGDLCPGVYAWGFISGAFVLGASVWGNLCQGIMTGWFMYGGLLRKGD